MLVLKRKLSESIVLDRDIRITVLRIRGNAISLGIEAPSEIGVRRGEAAMRSDRASCPVPRGAGCTSGAAAAPMP